jgi:murein DD-endopeptidase MepM/ murein hydrolase activator NlpD
MMKNSQPTPLSLRELAFGVLAASLAASVLIVALCALAVVARRADAAALRTLHHRFPVPSRHSYGDGVGARRGHQGQDIFAACGKRILAARGGQVQFRDRDSSAGNYLVIDGNRTRVDYVYMHLRRSGLRVHRGEHVRTGQRIAKVGQSGNAVGCHLHFEMWTRPGWYEGGHFMESVTKHLRAWDRADG